MKKLKHRLSHFVAEKVLRHYLVPFSRHGLPPALVKWWKPNHPVVVIDCGASSGSFTEAVSKHFKIQRGLLVEPLPARCEELQVKYKSPVFTVHQCALADYEGSRQLAVLNFDYATSLLPLSIPASCLNQTWNLSVRETIDCSIRTLDSVLAENLHETGIIDLLKIDVQGAEVDLLKGALQTLRRVKYVLCEVSFRPLYAGSAIFSEVYEFMAGAGFRLLQIDEGTRTNEKELIQADALFRNGRTLSI